jgi:hypothetical protein
MDMGETRRTVATHIIVSIGNTPIAISVNITTRMGFIFRSMDPLSYSREAHLLTEDHYENRDGFV